MQGTMTPELLAGLAGAALSLVMSYIPGLSTWYNARSPNGKRLVMGAMLAIMALGSALWSCAHPADNATFRSCVGGIDWRSYFTALLSALVANQATHQLTPKEGGK